MRMQRKRKVVKRVALTPAARRMLAEGTVRPYGGAQYALARRLRNQGLFKINFSDGSYRVTDAGRAALAAQPDATMAEIAAVTPRIIHKSYGAHVGQPDRDDLTVLAVCNNINGPIAPSGCMTADDKKVTCKRCLRIVAGLPVGARRKTSKHNSDVGLDTSNREHARQLATETNLDTARAVFVFDLARDWVREGLSGDNPGVARAAYDLLIKHNVEVKA